MEMLCPKFFAFSFKEPEGPTSGSHEMSPQPVCEDSPRAQHLRAFGPESSGLLTYGWYLHAALSRASVFLCPHRKLVQSSDGVM